MRDNTDPGIERLRRCPLFASFPDSELAAVLQLTDEIEVEAGRVLTRQESPAREAFVIVEGTCRLWVDDVEVAVVGPGDVVGEIGLLDVGGRSATVVADTAVRLLAMDPRGFAVFVERQPAGRAVMRQLVARLRGADARATTTG